MLVIRSPSSFHVSQYTRLLRAKQLRPKNGGEGGIRTHERVLAVTRFRGERVQPALPPLQARLRSIGTALHSALSEPSLARGESARPIKAPLRGEP